MAFHVPLAYFPGVGGAGIGTAGPGGSITCVTTYQKITPPGTIIGTKVKHGGTQLNNPRPMLFLLSQSIELAPDYPANLSELSTVESLANDA